MLQAGRPRGYAGFPRTRAEVERFFTGLDIVPPYPGVEPALAYVEQWGTPEPTATPSRIAYAAVARKP